MTQTAIIPDADHVSRYCKPSTVQNGRVMPTAFYFDGDPHLSVNWLEYLGAHDIELMVDAVRKVLDKKLAIRFNGRIAVLNVGAVRGEVKNAIGAILRVEHAPQPSDASHASISVYGTADLGGSQAGAGSGRADLAHVHLEHRVATRIALLLDSGDVYPAKNKNSN